MYKQNKSNKSSRSNTPSKSKSKSKSKSGKKGKKSNNMDNGDFPITSSNKQLDEYLSAAIQTDVALLRLPLQILEIILYDYFYAFQRYGFVAVCKLFKYLIDDTLQSILNNSINDGRIHDFKLNANYFYLNLDEFIVTIKNSIIMDLSNETLRIFNSEQRKFISYIFMYQSKLALLYKKELLSPKYKKMRRRHERKKKHNMKNMKNMNDDENDEEFQPPKTDYEILADFVRILSECNKVICGGNAVWFHVSGMNIFGPILYSKYCQISSLSLDRDYINDEILLSFCKSLLFRNVLYSELSPFYDCSFLKRLDLSHNNNISDIGMNTLFAVIGEKCPMMQEIYLSNLPSITNLTCKIIYKFYQLFAQRTRLKIIVLNRNKFIDHHGVDVLNDLFKNNVIDIGENIRFFVSNCRIDENLLYDNSWDHRIKLEMPQRIHQ